MHELQMLYLKKKKKLQMLLFSIKSLVLYSLAMS